jgi:hypothetical protein
VDATDASTDTGASVDALTDGAIDTAAFDADLPDAPDDLPDGLPTVVCDAGQPVAECVEYFAFLSACAGEDFLGDACQPSSSPRARRAFSRSSRCVRPISSDSSRLVREGVATSFVAPSRSH